MIAASRGPDYVRSSTCSSSLMRSGPLDAERHAPAWSPGRNCSPLGFGQPRGSSAKSSPRQSRPPMMRFESFSHTERNTEQNMQYQRFSTERLWADTADLLFIRANFRPIGYREFYPPRPPRRPSRTRSPAADWAAETEGTAPFFGRGCSPRLVGAAPESLSGRRLSPRLLTPPVWRTACKCDADQVVAGLRPRSEFEDRLG